MASNLSMSGMMQRPEHHRNGTDRYGNRDIKKNIIIVHLRILLSVACGIHRESLATFPGARSRHNT